LSCKELLYVNIFVCFKR